ncbi:MAG: hypothetical protein KC912_26375 [Proteobacteria bacterium]|nr:hypothetical protein [Pseudomonadota bacterium]
MSDEVVERIRRLMDVDLVRLLDAIEEADDALLQLEAGKRVAKATASPPPPRRGEKAAPVKRAPRKANPRRLREAWDAVQERLIEHIERERSLILPGCLHVAEGMSSIRGGLQTPIRQMVVEHRDLGDAVLAVRLECARVELVRREFLLVCRLWDEHVDTEETMIFAESLADLTDEVSAISRTLDLNRGADDVGARLRLAAARKAVEQPEPKPEPTGVMGRLRSLWGRKS